MSCNEPLVGVRFVFHRSAGFKLKQLANLFSNLVLEASITSPDRESVTLGTGADNYANNLRLLPELSNAGEHEFLPESGQVGAMTLQADGPATSVAEALPCRADFITEEMIVAIVVQLGGALQMRVVAVIECNVFSLEHRSKARVSANKWVKTGQTYSTNPSIDLKVPRCLRLLEKPSADALDPEVFLEYQKDQGV